MRLVLCSLLLLWSCGAEAKDANAPGLSCRDENDSVVPWYILYKGPKGQKYIYISTKGKKKTNKNIGDPHGVLANTLSPMFNMKLPDTFAFLSYNDQSPVRGSLNSDSFGHSKGVVLGDKATKTALWLTHSTPKFPKKRTRKGFWPSTGELKAQTFMCVTLEYGYLESIGSHLQNIRAFTFNKQIPGNFPKSFVEAGNNEGAAPRGSPAVQDLEVGNTQLKAVAKVTGKSAADGDLYVQLSRLFNSDIDAKPWGGQPGKDRSYCEPNKHRVMNVIKVKTSLGRWGWGSDHSKWAVTTDNNAQWTCIADMNRAPSQYERPGGALCIQDQTVKDLFRGFVSKRLPCGEDPSNAAQYVKNDEEEELSDDFENDEEEELSDDSQNEEEELSDDFENEEEELSDDSQNEEEEELSDDSQNEEEEELSDDSQNEEKELSDDFESEEEEELSDDFENEEEEELSDRFQEMNLNEKHEEL